MGRTKRAAGDTATKKVGYDPKADLAKGVCGYDGCKKKLPSHDEDEEKPISCEDHGVTHSVAYKYMAEAECQRMYNTDVPFSDCFDSSHGIIHKNEEKDCMEGHCGGGERHYQDAGRDYGAYNLSEPLEL